MRTKKKVVERGNFLTEKSAIAADESRLMIGMIVEFLCIASARWEQSVLYFCPGSSSTHWWCVGEEWPWCARACRRHCCGTGRFDNSDDRRTRRHFDSNLQHQRRCKAHAFGDDALWAQKYAEYLQELFKRHQCTRAYQINILAEVHEAHFTLSACVCYTAERAMRAPPVICASPASRRRWK